MYQANIAQALSVAIAAVLLRLTTVRSGRSRIASAVVTTEVVIDNFRMLLVT